jgi:hypothetical protein
VIMWKYLSQLTQTHRGQSAGRLGFLLTIGLSNIVVWPLLVFLTLYNKAFPVIPEGVVYLYAAAQGLSFAGKAAQSFADRNKGDDYYEKLTGKAKEYVDRS